MLIPSEVTNSFALVKMKFLKIQSLNTKLDVCDRVSGRDPYLLFHWSWDNCWTNWNTICSECTNHAFDFKIEQRHSASPIWIASLISNQTGQIEVNYLFIVSIWNSHLFVKIEIYFSFIREETLGTYILVGWRKMWFRVKKVQLVYKVQCEETIRMRG